MKVAICHVLFITFSSLVFLSHADYNGLVGLQASAVGLNYGAKKLVRTQRKRFLQHVIQNDGLNLNEGLLREVRDYLMGAGRTGRLARHYYTRVIESLEGAIASGNEPSAPPRQLEKSTNQATLEGKRMLLRHVAENKPLLKDKRLKGELEHKLSDATDAQVDQLYRKVVDELLIEDLPADKRVVDVNSISGMIGDLQNFGNDEPKELSGK